MEVKTFISLIEKYYGFLMKDYGFTVSYSNGLGGSKDCTVIIQSRECRIMFWTDSGQFLISVGSKYAPNSYIPPRKSYELLTSFAHLWYFTEFLTQGPDHVSWSYPSPKWGMVDDATIERQMVKLSKITKPYWGLVIDFFETKEFEAKIKELDTFIHKIHETRGIGVPFEEME